MARSLRFRSLARATITFAAGQAGRDVRRRFHWGVHSRQGSQFEKRASVRQADLFAVENIRLAGTFQCPKRTSGDPQLRWRCERPRLGQPTRPACSALIRHSNAGGAPEVRSAEKLITYLKNEYVTFPDGGSPAGSGC